MLLPRMVHIGYTDLSSPCLDSILSEYFDYKDYVKNESYDPARDLLVVSRREAINDLALVELLDQGFKLIISDLSEAFPHRSSLDFTSYLENILVVLGTKNPYNFGWKNILGNLNWFWYRESLTIINDENYQNQKNYIPQRKNSKLFFMPIRRAKPWRSQIVNRLSDVLDNSIYSYVDHDIQLPTMVDDPLADVRWDRQFNSIWYDDTYFSIAVETGINMIPTIKHDGALARPYLDTQLCEMFITEKAFKPIAHQHPFMVYGIKGTLRSLRESGFETYDHIFDETYDGLDIFEDRVEAIYNNIKNFSVDKYLNPLTEEKIAHNHNLFYDTNQITQGMKRDLIDPILEWIHAT